MRALFSAIVSWLLSRLFHQSPPLSQEAQQAKQVGAAEAKLQTEAQTNVEVQAAIAASRTVERQLGDRPDLLRQSSPDSRD